MAVYFTWQCDKECATWKGSGFTFVGKKFEANATFGSQSKTYEFYIDEFGIPEWLRNVRFVESTDLNKDSEEDLEDYHEGFSKRANNLGFNATMIDLYNKYGYHESHQLSTINYWFPASTSPHTYYSTPRQSLVDIYINQHYTEEQSKEMARDMIEKLVEKMHNHGLKVVGYIDPNRLYSPDTLKWDSSNPFWLEEKYLHGGATVAHHKDTEYGWCRRHDYLSLSPPRNDTIERLDYVETSIDQLGFGIFSDIDDLALEVCPSGPSKMGSAWEDSGFEYSKIKEDIDNYYEKNGNYNNLSGEDPSWHYEQVKQMHFLAKKYGFDIINVDDTGRLIMKAGPAPYYKNDVWASLLGPACPTDLITYKTCDDDKYCQHRREDVGATKDGFALDSYANMLKHMRWQLKPPSEDDEHCGALMSGDYFVPSDVTWNNEKGQKTYWKSITAVEDASVTDQFSVWESEFARWAYKNFNIGYRVLRTDLRRTFTFIPLLRPEFTGYTDKHRRALQMSLMLATAWANRVHCDLNDARDVKDKFDQSLFSNLDEDFEDWQKELNSDVKTIVNYLLMGKKLDEAYSNIVPIPLFKEREAQELLYNQRFEDYYDMKNINKEGEYYYVDGKICDPSGSDFASEPYTVLYSLPCEYGEKGRILHIMNSRVISDVPYNEVAADYMFKIKIPEGEAVDKVYLVSADLYDGHIDPDRDKKEAEQEIEQQNFYSDITEDKGKLWWSVYENSQRYIKIKVPHVIAYTAALIEFKEQACDLTGDAVPCDGIVDDFELLEYIKLWAKGKVNDFDLLEAIKNWAQG